MPYKIPQCIEYEEKIALGLTFRQFFFMLVTGLPAASIFLRSGRVEIAVSLVCFGLGLSFLGWDKTIMDAIRFAGTKIKLRRIKDVTRDFIGVDEIRNNAVVLKDGSLVSIIRVRGLNFSLYNDEQRRDLVSSFKGVVNSLGFPIQIVVKSVDPDLDDYFNSLEEQNPKNRIIKSLREHLGRHIRENNVKDRVYYLVVPLHDQARLIDSLKNRIKNEGL